MEKKRKKHKSYSSSLPEVLHSSKKSNDKRNNAKPLKSESKPCRRRVCPAETRSIETQLITLFIAWPAFKVHTFFTSLHFTSLYTSPLIRERMSWTQSGNLIVSGGKTGTTLGKLASLHCISIGATTTHIHPPTHPQIKTLGTIYQLPT